MTKTLKSGDRVKWSASGGTAMGKVVKKVTSPMKIKGHKVAASKDNPEYLVETDEGYGSDDEPDSVAYDAGAAGGGASAEELAIHETNPPRYH